MESHATSLDRVLREQRAAAVDLPAPVAEEVLLASERASAPGPQPERAGNAIEPAIAREDSG